MCYTLFSKQSLSIWGIVSGAYFLYIEWRWCIHVGINISSTYLYLHYKKIFNTVVESFWMLSPLESSGSIPARLDFMKCRDEFDVGYVCIVYNPIWNLSIYLTLVGMYTEDISASHEKIPSNLNSLLFYSFENIFMSYGILFAMMTSWHHRFMPVCEDKSFWLFLSSLFKSLGHQKASKSFDWKKTWSME